MHVHLRDIQYDRTEERTEKKKEDIPFGVSELSRPESISPSFHLFLTLEFRATSISCFDQSHKENCMFVHEGEVCLYVSLK